jgi:glyoxylase-like metal-dependent hydrolase (beta-lactamase superfamily II)
VGMHVTVLGSGSAGNCLLVETETTAILVDAGLSARQIVRRLQLIGRNIDRLNGIVLTHEHTDHTRLRQPTHRRSHHDGPGLEPSRPNLMATLRDWPLV